MINPNTDLKNLHTLFLARSGHGKSSCVKMKSGLPARGARACFFDPNLDHPAHRFTSMAQFARAVARAHRSGRGFRISYAGARSPEVFEQWCEVVAAILDGELITYGMIEEYGRVCRNPGLITPQDSAHAILWGEGRKYGLRLTGTSQRPQQVTKDALENAGIIWAGGMGSLAAKRVGAEIDVAAHELRSLPVGTFYRWQEGPEDAEKIQVFVPRPAAMQAVL